jgi:hypothetical protein
MSQCKWMGDRHVAREDLGMWGPETVSPKFEGIDGMGTYHYGIWLKCSRCGKEFRVARFHSARPIEFDGSLAKLYNEGR